MNEQNKFYSRQVKLIGVSGQEKINNSRVLIIGAGGLGCPALQYIAAMGVGYIGIIDNDIIDVSNLHRQILFNVEDVGKGKSQVVAEKIRKQNPYIKVISYSEKLNRENAEIIFEDYQIVVDCTDNFETKFLVHDICYLKNKKLVQSSIYQFEGNLHVFDFSTNESKKALPCLRCLWTKEPEDGCIGTCADVGVIGATAGVLGSLMATEVSKIILGGNYLKNGEGLFVDLTTQDYEKRRWQKNLKCSLCSVAPEVNYLISDYKIEFNKLTTDFIWIDLRSDEEIKDFSIGHSALIHRPVSSFNTIGLDDRQKYLLICQRGFRSNHLARALRDKGHDNFFSLVDGVLNLKNDKESIE